MPKLLCKCGNLIDMSEIPAPDGYLLLSEQDWDQARAQATDLDGYDVELSRGWQETYLCPVCSRLIVFWSTNPLGVPTYYRREE